MGAAQNDSMWLKQKNIIVYKGLIWLKCYEIKTISIVP